MPAIQERQLAQGTPPKQPQIEASIRRTAKKVSRMSSVKLAEMMLRANLIKPEAVARLRKMAAKKRRPH
jgi:hypothetical protein